MTDHLKIDLSLLVNRQISGFIRLLIFIAGANLFSGHTIAIIEQFGLTTLKSLLVFALNPTSRTRTNLINANKNLQDKEKATTVM